MKREDLAELPEDEVPLEPEGSPPSVTILVQDGVVCQVHSDIPQLGVTVVDLDTQEGVDEWYQMPELPRVY